MQCGVCNVCSVCDVWLYVTQCKVCMYVVYNACTYVMCVCM